MYGAGSVPTFAGSLTGINKKYFASGGKCSHNYYTYDGQTGISLDIYGDDDELYYNLPSTWTSGDFAIEMNVRFSDSNPGTSRFLFQLGNYKLFLSPGGGDEKIKLKLNSDETEDIINSFYDGDFHKVIVKRIHDGSSYEYSLKIDSTPIGDFDTNDSIGGNQLYIGSTSSSTYQVNDIIDYVKFYTKP